MDKLNILWTTSCKITFNNMILMYATNALKKGWWEEVNIVIWGGSAKLIGEDTEVQKQVIEMIDSGVSVKACRACSDHLGVTETLSQLGIEVRYMGELLTSYLKNGEKLLSI